MNDRMSNEEFRNYAALLGSLLRLGPTQREAIEDELRAHMEERFTALTAQGIGPDRAISMAVAEFGDAAALATQFSAVAKLRKRRWMMRFTMTVTVAAVALVFVAMSVWPGGSGRLADTTARAQQIEKSEPDKKPTPAKTEKSDPNSQTLAKLDASIDAQFIDTPLQDFLDYLADAVEVQFYVDERALSDKGLTDDDLITIDLKEVPAEMVLRLMLRQLDLAYMLDHGVVIITTPERAENNLDTRVYRIDDLVRIPAAPERATPTDVTFDDRDAIIHLVQPGGVRQPAKKMPLDEVDVLIELITSTIKPESWIDMGGGASIAPYRGTLVISQTELAHRKVEKLLDDLREAINPDFPVRPAGDNRGGSGMGGGMGMF